MLGLGGSHAASIVGDKYLDEFAVGRQSRLDLDTAFLLAGQHRVASVN